MVFFDYKVVKEMCAQPIPPFWERWRRWLYDHQRHHHTDDTLFISGGTSGLRNLPKELYKGMDCTPTGWHPWKRTGAAGYRAFGGSSQALTV